eukprot:TRINITY_DN15057_c0_g1_i1.p1 TRINITY_DN15057_c0_g1~~TRINITY_DN15057_c0_g1_i1.p1  ORF type:complete len:520 (+),score=198.80 TRINITY_DN15057_c0_g1_i1:358-1917(+)
MSVSSHQWSLDGTSRKSMWTAYVFTINVVFGSGVLAMPHAIQSAGLGLGIFMLAVVSVIAWITCMWVVESIGRLCFVNTLWDDLIVREADSDDGPIIPKQDFQPEIVPHLVTNQDFDQIDRACHADISQVTRGWELNELCTAFLGTRVAMAYDACLCLYTWAVMWLYVTVWCQAFVTIIPLPTLTSFKECNNVDDGECLRAYRWFVLVFTAVMSVLCVREWKVFNKIQSGFTIYAYVCLFMMLVSIMVGLGVAPYNVHEGDPPADYVAPDDSVLLPEVEDNRTAPYTAHGNQFANMEEFGLLFGCCIFSQMAHQGTAQILFVMSDKAKAGQLFGFSFLTTMLFYIVLSLASALYFGDEVNSIVTLNWKHYSWFADGHQNWAIDLLFVLIVIFPVGTTSAAYMFFVRTLGQQMEHWLPYEVLPFASNKYLCRFIAFFPPIVGGIATHNVKTIVTVAGLLGFFIMVFFPAALQMQSIMLLRRLGAPEDTPFSGWHSPLYVVYTMLVFGSAGFVYYVYNMTQ